MAPTTTFGPGASAASRTSWVQAAALSSKPKPISTRHCMKRNSGPAASLSLKSVSRRSTAPPPWTDSLLGWRSGFNRQRGELKRYRHEHFRKYSVRWFTGAPCAGQCAGGENSQAAGGRRLPRNLVLQPVHEGRI